MKRLFHTILLVLALAGTALAQMPTPPGFIPQVTFANLPVGSPAGTVRYVTNTDGASCNGSAGTVMLCRFTGSSWVPGGGGGSGSDTDDQIASEVPFTPAGSLLSTDVQAALEELDREKQGSIASTANQLISGGGVAWTGNLNFTVSAATYLIAGNPFSSAQTNLTLSAADPTNPRIDVIAVNASGAVVVLEGTPAASPQAPSIDPTAQFQLTFVLIGAGATTPTGVASTNIYLENTEWTMARSPATSPPWNLASTNNPLAGTVDVEATSAAAGNFITAVKPAAGTETLSTYNNLVINIRNKAAWPGAKSLSVFFLNGSTPVGNAVAINNGAFGFVNANITSYQQIVIPLTLFLTGTNPVTSLRIQVVGGGAAIGFYLDNIFLQGGLTPSGVPANAMLFRGPWVSTTAYAPFDVVTNGGTSWIALLGNTNSSPTSSNTNWSALEAPLTANRILLGGGTAAGPVVLGSLGSTTTVLHGNAAGAPTFGAVSLSADVTGVLPAANNTVAVLDGSVSYCADAGSNDTYACSLSPAPAGYVTGARYRFKANTANTGAATINFNSLGAITIVKVAGGITTTLANNDIRVGQVVEIAYDGTNMQMQSLLGNAAAAGGTETRRIPINLRNPRGTTLGGNSYYTVTALTNIDLGMWQFVKDVDGHIYGTVHIPPNVAGTPNFKVILIIGANATSGVTRVNTSTKCVAEDGESYNVSLTDDTAQDITVPGTARLTKKVTFTAGDLTNCIARDILFMVVTHIGSHANDTLAVDTELVDAYLEADLTL